MRLVVRGALRSAGTVATNFPLALSKIKFPQCQAPQIQKNIISTASSKSYELSLCDIARLQRPVVVLARNLNIILKTLI